MRSRTAPLTAIRRMCLWCAVGSNYEIAVCASKVCPLWLFRFGREPSPALIEARGDAELRLPEALGDGLPLGEFPPRVFFFPRPPTTQGTPA
jgi:hypothetical protein